MNIRDLSHVSIFDFEGRVLKEVVKYLSPKILFESGTNNGYATGWILDGIRESGFSEAVFYSCDPRRFPSKENLPKDCHKGDYQKNNSHFLFMKESSIEFLRRNFNKEFDFAFLDGDHRKQIVYEELNILRIGQERNDTIIFLHDVRPNLEPKEKDPYWGLLEYVEKELAGKYNLFNLIVPGSLATNLDVVRIKKILENSNLEFDCKIIPLGEFKKWLESQEKSQAGTL